MHTTRTCVTTCGRGDGHTRRHFKTTHWKRFFESTHGGEEGGGGEGEAGVNRNMPTLGYHVLQSITGRNPINLHIFSLRKGREQHVPESSNHSLYLIKLLSSSYPEGHCGWKQLRDSPLSPSPTNDKHNTHPPTHPPTHHHSHLLLLLLPHTQHTQSKTQTQSQTHTLRHTRTRTRLCTCKCICICLCICK